MKPVVALVGFFAFLAVSATRALAQVPAVAPAISVTRTMNGCDITLSPEVAKTVYDQVWVVIDGTSEGAGGYNFAREDAAKPLHYKANVNDDLDGQVKDILKAQGLPVKADITTYHITYAVNVPSEYSISHSLHFRTESGALGYTQFPTRMTYKVGEKIPIFEAVAVDASVATSGILGKSAERQNQLPHDLLHRITIQVQFVPKTPGMP